MHPLRVKNKQKVTIRMTSHAEDDILDDVIVATLDIVSCCLDLLVGIVAKSI